MGFGGFSLRISLGTQRRTSRVRFWGVAALAAMTWIRHMLFARLRVGRSPLSVGGPYCAPFLQLGQLPGHIRGPRLPRYAHNSGTVLLVPVSAVGRAPAGWSAARSLGALPVGGCLALWHAAALGLRGSHFIR